MRVKRGEVAGVVFEENPEWHRKFGAGELLPWKGETFVLCEMRGPLMVMMNVRAKEEMDGDKEP